MAITKDAENVVTIKVIGIGGAGNNVVNRMAAGDTKGVVTTPTVRMPASRAMSAIVGAAPVPVPPPMPAVMKHMCAPSST